jgi:hypothetical protein
MLLANEIIAPGQDDTAPVGRLIRQVSTQHAVQHPSHRQQLLGRAQRARGQRPGLTLQIAPRRRDPGAAAVRQHQEQIEPPAAAHPPDQLKRADVQRMARPHHPDCRREAIEVGSVSCLLSMIPVAIGQPSRSAVG